MTIKLSSTNPHFTLEAHMTLPCDVQLDLRTQQRVRIGGDDRDSEEILLLQGLIDATLWNLLSRQQSDTPGRNSASRDPRVAAMLFATNRTHQ